MIPSPLLAMMSPNDFSPGTVLGQKFQIVRLLGSGGMGAVYEVEHILTKHRRALKLLHPEARARAAIAERFLREASAAGRIGNPHIVETFDAGALDTGEPYLVMELLRGTPLTDELARRGRLELPHLASLIGQACNGVQAAHDAGIVHRDLKPDNLFIVERDGQPFVKILDFGISKFDTTLTGDHAVTQEGSVLGTPYYMPPEQVRGAKDLDARADVYALGVILYECASGARPFDADTLPHLAVLIDEGRPAALIERNPGLPTGFCEVVAKAMARERQQRFESVAELGTALLPFERSLSASPGGTLVTDTAPAGRASLSSVPAATVVMPESAPPPPLDEASDTASRPTPLGARPASLESAALGRTLGVAPHHRRSWLFAAGLIVLLLLAILGFVRAAGQPSISAETESTSSASPGGAASATLGTAAAPTTSSPAASPRPVEEVTADSGSATPVKQASTTAAQQSPAIGPSAPAAKPAASTTKSQAHGLAQDNPY